MRTLVWNPCPNGAVAVVLRAGGRTVGTSRFADLFLERPYEMKLFNLGVDGKINVRLAGAGYKDVRQFSTIDEAKTFVESVFALESD